MRYRRGSAQQPKSIVSSATTAVAGITALGLVLGFMITNAYLFSRGLIGYAISNSQYLAAGLCFLFFYLLAGLVFVVFPKKKSLASMWGQAVVLRDNQLQLKVQERRRKLGWTDANMTDKDKLSEFYFIKFFKPGFAVGLGFTYIATVAVANIWSYAVFSIVSLSILAPLSADVLLFVSPAMYLWATLVTFGVLIFNDILRSTSRVPILLAFWFILLLVVSTLVYGIFLYPRISPAIGGGAPVRAILVIEDARKSEVEALLGYPVIGGKTADLNLLFETSDSLIVDSGGQSSRRTAQLRKDLVKGLIYTKASAGILSR